MKSIKTIVSLNNPFIKEIQKLRQKRYRDETETFIVEGYHTVKEAKRCGYLKTVLIVHEQDGMDGVENVLVNDAVMRKLSKAVTPQPVIGICRYLPDVRLKGDKFLLLDSVRDPGNMGTLIRSALGFNIDNIIIGPDCVDIYNDKVLRATQGAIFNIPIGIMNIKECLLNIKRRGISVYGTFLKRKELLSVIPKPPAFALVLGNESRGISAETAELCDFNICIETNRRLESLNVAVAGSIIMYCFTGDNFNAIKRS